MLAWFKRKHAAEAAPLPDSAPDQAPDPWAEALAGAERFLADGDLAQCESACREILDAEADHPRALVLLGKCLARQGAPERARACLERATEVAPDFADAHLFLGALLRLHHELEAASDHLELAVHFAPESVDAKFELACVCGLQGNLTEAEAILRQAIEVDPGHLPSTLELATLLEKQNRIDEALEFAERALTLAPDATEALNSLRHMLFLKERYDEALPLAERVVAKTPDSAFMTRLDLGNCYLYLGRFEEAAAMFDHVLRYEPKNFAARWNRAHYLLASERFPEGWVDYRYRFHSHGVAMRSLPFPEWRNEPLEGKTLLVFCEQGLGDEIMFASCFPEVIARARHCVIECDARLEALFRRSFPKATIVVATRDHDPHWLRDLGSVDYQIPAGTLPSLMRNAWSDFPKHDGYLVADPEKVARWRARLDALGPGLKVGISWRGGTRLTRSTARSIPAHLWQPILATQGCRFVSLQYGKVAEELAAFRDETGTEIVHWQDAVDDYDETAALVCALDKVVSVCTSLIHLNGALGEPVWVMVPAVPEWRYLRKGESLPWYPSVRLFRQAELGNWLPVIDTVAGQLAAAVRQQGDRAVAAR